MSNFFAALRNLSPKFRFPGGLKQINNQRLQKQHNLDINTNVSKDVILFKYENPRLYKMVNLFGCCQFAFWTYLSVFSFETLKDVVPSQNKQDPWWMQINLGENKYRNGMSILYFVIGYGVLVVSWMYILKSVRFLILGKGGKKVSFVTYTPFGINNRIMTVDLANVNCKEGRTIAKSWLPLKVKGHRLHYILDMRGEFKNPTLFDYTAGLKRKWAS